MIIYSRCDLVSVSIKYEGYCLTRDHEHEANHVNMSYLDLRSIDIMSFRTYSSVGS